MPKTVAIIGAGLSGLGCAEALRQRNDVDVISFDKGRGPGGRLSTRRTDVGRFDHGAPFFSTDSSPLADVAQQWVNDGSARWWLGETGTAHPRVVVGHPTMNALLKPMAREVGTAFGVRVAGLGRPSPADRWTLFSENGAAISSVDIVIVAIPAPQAAALIGDVHSAFAELIGDVVYEPSWAAMAAFDGEVHSSECIEHPQSGPLALAVRDSAKPGRDAGERWVLHATPVWSRQHLEDDETSVAGRLLDAFSNHIDCDLPPITYSAAHRWRYARTSTPLDQPCLWDSSSRLGLCGDYFGGRDAATAWESGTALGLKIASTP